MNQALAQSNNLGVYYLEQGDLRHALTCFRDALAYNLESINSLEENEERITSGNGNNNGRDHGPNHSFSNYRHQRFNFPHLELDPRNGLESDKRPSYNSKSSLFLHSQGIAIDALLLGSQPVNDSVQLSLVGSTVLFNLATVYHLKAIEENALGRSKLEKAKSLYRKSFSLLQENGILFGFSTTGSAIVDLLIMALLNNLAQLSFELCNYEECKNHFDRLVNFSSSIMMHTYRDSRIEAFVFHHRSNFLLNAIALRSPEMASAA